DGFGINPNTLAGYLRGDIFPSERKVRLMADALEVPRGVLLFAAGYLRLEDLPDYPGANTTLDAVLADIEEVEQSPLSALAKMHILQGLRNTARILRMLNGERARQEWSVQPNERELLIEHMTLLWESPVPAPLLPGDQAAHPLPGEADTRPAPAGGSAGRPAPRGV
ncbi:MAG: hypothetical protein C5B60_01980, partial [Chloroflexi bacterium]